VASVGTRWTAATFEKIVTGAEQHGGGWVIFTVHDVCAKNCALGVTVPELRGVLAWLAGQASRGVSVHTVRQVVGGPVRPLVASPRPSRIPPPGVANSRLRTPAKNGKIPDCFQTAHYGTNTPTFSYSRNDGPAGAGAETITLAQRQSGTAQLLPTLDLGQCAPSVTPGNDYTIGAWYKSTKPVVFNLYYRTSIGTWKFWTSSPSIPASTSWKRARWDPPDVPSGASAVSFGLALSSNGTVATSRYSISPARHNYTGLIVFAAVVAGLVIVAFLAAKLRERHDWPKPE
jgi:hypothetical protein